MLFYAINKIKDYFNSEIREGKTMRKRLRKFIAAFNYSDQIVLSAASGGIFISSFASIISVSAELASASFSLAFFKHRNNKEIIRNNKKQKKA